MKQQKPSKEFEKYCDSNGFEAKYCSDDKCLQCLQEWMDKNCILKPKGEKK